MSQAYCYLLTISFFYSQFTQNHRRDASKVGLFYSPLYSILFHLMNEYSNYNNGVRGFMLRVDLCRQSVVYSWHSTHNLYTYKYEVISGKGCPSLDWMARCWRDTHEIHNIHSVENMKNKVDKCVSYGL